MIGEIEKIDSDFLIIIDNSNDYNIAVITYGIEKKEDELSKIASLLNLDLEKIDNFETLKTNYLNNNFIETSSKELIYIPTIITEKIKYLASQYRNSNRLKNLLLSSLLQFQDSFLETNKIPHILNLESAKGHNLDLIGKVTGVGRHYCGNFADVNYMFYKENKIEQKIREVTLSDECMKKLIVVKIIKNVKKIVNFKELREILAVFFEDENFSFYIDDFEIVIDTRAYNINEECLILLRAFLPIPANVELYYLRNFMQIGTIEPIATNFSQSQSLFLDTPKQIYRGTLKDSKLLATFREVDSFVVRLPIDRGEIKLISNDNIYKREIEISRDRLEVPPYLFSKKIDSVSNIAIKSISINRSSLSPVAVEDIEIDSSGEIISIVSKDRVEEHSTLYKKEIEISRGRLEVPSYLFSKKIDSVSNIAINSISISRNSLSPVAVEDIEIDSSGEIISIVSKDRVEEHNNIYKREIELSNNRLNIPTTQFKIISKNSIYLESILIDRQRLKVKTFKLQTLSSISHHSIALCRLLLTQNSSKTKIVEKDRLAQIGIQVSSNRFLNLLKLEDKTNSYLKEIQIDKGKI